MDWLSKLDVVLSRLIVGTLLVCACSSGTPPIEAETAAGTFVIHETPCGEDEARFRYCDSLLPTVSTRTAPEPFTACPGYLDIPEGSNSPIGTVAAFSPSQTEIARRRVGPGHSCCYSWCAKIVVADPSDAQTPEECVQRGAVRESYCIREPEAATSGSHAGAPYEHCPAALVPPSESAFSPPEAALLDLNETGQRRAQGTPDCCYGWCSKLPHGVWASPSAPEDEVPGSTD